MYGRPAPYGKPLPDSRMLVPRVYDEAISYEQQLANLIADMEGVRDTLAGYAKTADLAAWTERQAEEFSQLTDRVLTTMSALVGDIEERVRQIVRDAQSAGAYIENPVFGQYPQSTERTIWLAYDAVRYFADTAERLDACEKTAEQLDALNITAYDFDLYNLLSFSKQVPTV